MRICLKIEMRRGMSVHMRDCTGTLVTAKSSMFDLFRKGMPHRGLPSTMGRLAADRLHPQPLVAVA